MRKFILALVSIFSINLSAQQLYSDQELTSFAKVFLSAKEANKNIIVEIDDVLKDFQISLEVYQQMIEGNQPSDSQTLEAIQNTLRDRKQEAIKLRETNIRRICGEHGLSSSVYYKILLEYSVNEDFKKVMDEEYIAYERIAPE